MDAPPAQPAVVIEEVASCRTSELEPLIRRSVQSVNAEGYTVRFRFFRGPTGLEAEAHIDRPDGQRLAQRALESASDCSAAARGLAVWATLVLDEVTEPPPVERPPAPAMWPLPAVTERPSPEHHLFLEHKNGRRSLEFGFSGMLMSGYSSEGLAGVAAAGTIEVPSGWFLRPSFAAARSTRTVVADADIYLSLGTARFDVCRRIPGLYLERRGLQVEGCGGAELGFLRFDLPTGAAAGQTPETLPLVATGFAFAIRGDLASNLAAEVRSGANVNLLRDPFAYAGQKVEPELFTLRAELGLSWGFR